MTLQYLTLARQILMSNVTRLSAPYKLTFAVTDRCNYRCKTCQIWQRRPGHELTLDEIRTFFRSSPHFSWVHLTGGEIFLRTDIFEIVDVIMSECRHLVLLNFPSNGFLTDRIVATAAKITKLKPPKFFVTISVDGDEALNDAIRGVPGGWQRQLETFKQLRQLPGVDVALGMTLSSHNIGALEKTFAAAQQVCNGLTYDDFHVNIYHTSYYYGNEQAQCSVQDPERLIREIDTYRAFRKRKIHPVAWLEQGYLTRVEQYLRTNRTPLHCQALRSSCFLDPAGNVYPCSMYNRVIGNLRACEYDLARIWQAEETRNLQQDIWNFQCPQCWTPCEAYQSILGNLRSAF